MSELTLKLIILLLPGAIATIIYGKLIIHKEWNNFKYILLSTLFGMSSYLTLQCIISGLNFILKFEISELSFMPFSEINNLSIWKDITKSKDIPWTELPFAILISIMISFLMGLIENKKLIFRLARKMNFSDKYGDECLLYRYASREINGGWIYIHDIDKELSYRGLLFAYSNEIDTYEIELHDVTIYHYKDSKEINTVKSVFITFPKDKLIIEFPNNN